MKVAIFGPNLNDQSKGQFHVHAAGCADCKKYGKGRLGGDDHMATPMEVKDRVAVSQFVYEDILAENDSTAEEYLSEFHFAPCLKDLPKVARA